MKFKIGDKIMLQRLKGIHYSDTTYEKDPLSNIFNITSVTRDGFYLEEKYYYEEEDIKELYTKEDNPEEFL